jgi:non-specific protein-tyrosine kinase
VDVRRYAAALWSAAWLIALSLVLAVVIAVAVASQLPRSFESRATLYVGQSLNDPGLGYTSILASQAVAQSYAQLATTRPVLEGAIGDLGLQETLDPDLLAQRVTAEVPDAGVLLQVLVNDADPRQAASLANAIAQQLLDLAPARDEAQEATQRERLAQLDQRIAVSEDRILTLLAKPDRTADENVELAALERELNTLTTARGSLAGGITATSPNALTVVEPAVAPTISSGPSRVTIVLIAVAIALALSIGAAYVWDVWRHSEYARRDEPAG